MSHPSITAPKAGRKLAARLAAMDATERNNWPNELPGTADVEHGAPAPAKSRRTLSGNRGVSSNKKAAICRQLADVLKEGVSLTEALRIVAGRLKERAIAASLKDVQARVSSGETLAGSMAAHRELFDELWIALASAGEKDGTLVNSFDIAAGHFEREAELGRRVKGALAYPKLVVLVCIAVLLLMEAVVVPKFTLIYAPFHIRLPATTQVLVIISGALDTYWKLIVPVAILPIVAFELYRSSARGKLFFDRIKFKLPTIGKLAGKVAIARFAQVFDTCVQAGIPARSALSLAANASGSYVLKDAVNRLAMGGTADQAGELPPYVLRLILAGENPAGLPTMLDEITRVHEQDAEYSAQRVMRVLELATTIAIGGTVLFVLLALYLPLFSLPHLRG